ncbi:MAG: hypothetical protein GEU99_16255 [Luteitalea sp.]|nr:hypothetical protein [Luteitalea sp.]
MEARGKPDRLGDQIRSIDKRRFAARANRLTAEGMAGVEEALAITRMLGYARGPEPWSIDEAVARWGEEAAYFAFGSTSRVRADKLRPTLGWTPTRPGLLEESERGSYSSGPNATGA